jgi:plasmid stabilization system protein ParE
LDEASAWYDAQRPGLGDSFVDSFRDAMTAVAHNPLQYQLFGRRARRAPLREFPYRLVYYASDSEIVVLACFHDSRDPTEWLD